MRALAKRSAILLTALVGCTQPTAPLDYAGYLEGDYQYAASSLAGRITQLSVQRGARMSAGSALFALDAELELAATEEALQRVKRAEAALSDLQSGRRAPEVAALQAQLAQARALEKLALQEAKRAELLAQRKLIAPELLETRRSEAVRAAARVREMRAQLDTAALIGRPAVLLGAQADVAAANASLEQAQWRLAQKQVLGHEPGVVDEVLFRPGEFVAAGQAVLRLLPDARRRVRFFVPAIVASDLKLGKAVRVRLLNGQDLDATIDQIASSPEYTPPVIYSNELRETLVFRIEAQLNPASEASPALPPGMPVTVQLR